MELKIDDLPSRYGSHERTGKRMEHKMDSLLSGSKQFLMGSSQRYSTPLRQNPSFMRKKALLSGLILLIILSLGVIFFHTPVGEKKWSFQVGSSITDSSPVVANGTVYIASNRGKVYALDTGSGRERWSYQTNVPPAPNNGIYSSLAVANGMVYVVNSGFLYAFDAISGRKQWFFPVITNMDVSPVIVNNIIYAGAQDGQLYALDALSGRKKWSFQTGNAIIHSPTVMNGIVYIDTLGGDLHALDALSGHEKWSFDEAVAIESSPVIVNDALYIASLYGMVTILDSISGRVK